MEPHERAAVTAEALRPGPLAVSVVVPTWRRPAWLRRCVEAAAHQQPPPDEIVVVLRPVDAAAIATVDELRDSLSVPVRRVDVEHPGHVAPIERGLAAARGDVVAILDDDAEPEPGWLAALVEPFADPRVGCVGGRVVTASTSGVANRVHADAGCVRWYGELVGNLGELEAPAAVERDTAVECNWAWRAAVLRGIELDPALDYDDAAFYGLDLTLQAQALGLRVVYAPRARVLHHLAPRDDGLARADRAARVAAACRNYTYVALKHFPLSRRVAFLVWWALLGRRGAHGVAAAAADLAQRGGSAVPEIRASFRGKADGLRLWRRTRRTAARPVLARSSTVCRPRVVVFDARPAQCSGPLYAALTASGSLDLRVVFWQTAAVGQVADPELGHPPGFDEPLTNGYRFESARSRGLGGLIDLVRRAAAARRSDLVVVSGWGTWRARLLLILSLLFRLPLAVSSDATSLDEPGRRLPWMRRVLLGSVLRRSPVVMAAGSLARAHLEDLGVQRERIFLRPYAIDDEAFSRKTTALRARRAELRDELGIARDATVLVAVAKFVAREGIDELIRGLAQVESHGAIVCAVVGDGPERERFERQAAALGVVNVRFVGYRPYSDLARFYAIADVFVHPARREPWGVSVNEAMASGLPVIVSDRVGAGYDLVHDGGNGYVYDSGDPSALARAIERFAGLTDEQRKSMGKESRRAAQSWGFERCATEFHEAIAYVRDTRRPKRAGSSTR